VKPLRVFGHVQHLGHQYELLKLAKKYPIKFSYLENNVRRWTKYSARPEPTTWLSPDQFEWVQWYEPGKYDLVILHCDQQCADPLMGKGQLIRQLKEVVGDSAPIIVINHGTPMWSEMFPEEVVKYGGTANTHRGPRPIDGIAKLVEGTALMVVNSYDSVARWGDVHPNIYPMIHGLDPEEWHDLPKEPRVVLPLSAGGLDDYYNRSLCTAIKGAVKERTGLTVMHPNVNISFDSDNWEQYREFIGSSLICIFPFKDSPMPRSRTEAMLSGSVVLSSRYHNANEFITHGVDGFIVPDNPLSYAEAIHLLINEAYREGVEIGKRGRETAKKYFHVERYLDDWYKLMTAVVGGERPMWDGKKVWDK
jgi:hypothetical protein